MSEELKRFVELVLEERREKFLQFMIMSYIDLYRKQKNIGVGKITTVCPVAEEVVNRIRALVVEKTHGTVSYTHLDVYKRQICMWMWVVAVQRLIC